MKRGKVLLESVTEDLSGGESQIVALLRALQLEPAILLLDEPTASLDDDAARCLEELVKTWLKAESDRACIWTSHNVVQLERVTDRQIDLDEATL
jgi:putative ABC transport system ATP-binding protein